MEGEDARKATLVTLVQGEKDKFLSAYGPIAQHFRPRRHLLSAAEYRQEMQTRFESWAEITGTKRAA